MTTTLVPMGLYKSQIHTKKLFFLKPQVGLLNSNKTYSDHQPSHEITTVRNFAAYYFSVKR